MFKQNLPLTHIASKSSRQTELRAIIEEQTEKAKKYHYKYINPNAVKNIVGKWTPVSVWNFSLLMECFIAVLNDSGSSIMNAKGIYKTDIAGVSDALIGIGEKLLRNNRNYKSGSWKLLNELDFDITHSCVEGEPVETMVKPYFAFEEFHRTKEETRIIVHATVARFEGTIWTISFPLQYIMQGYPNIKNQHYGYCHKIALLDENGDFNKEYVYVGVTGRNWLQRMNEHFNEIKSGSKKLFHQTWREFTGKKNVILSSELVVGDHNFEQIMSWEEDFVDRYMKSGISLNMIPGGFKGMHFLHKHRLLNSDRVTLKERDMALVEYQRQHPKAGIPNLLISELWKDDEYAARIICGSEGRLSVDQVHEIRKFNDMAIPLEKIVELVNALNIQQVQRVIKGQTYSRIH
ncbi:GIY-YIG nuclease family protein [Thiothrix lacustris]|uniref:GIY-YIG nuclease family protein n=1 Tax=Thiothrix lacustris TaxID=525917 RepID=UPI0027E3E238|nr:GIY-YIG nuclease family protein [Thiothrix lacustris]WMP17646.1 hypothetical protein RCS87_00940 [Thiothrix lacustris]